MEPADGGEEDAAEVGRDLGLLDLLVQHIIAEQRLVVEVPLEGWLDRGLEEGGDEEGEGAKVDPVEAEPAVARAAVERELLRLLQHVGVEPGLHQLGDGHRVRHPQVPRGASVVQLGVGGRIDEVRPHGERHVAAGPPRPHHILQPRHQLLSVRLPCGRVGRLQGNSEHV